jgi:pimeloyl-ACP methyl ester carboxylesterase
MMATHTDPCVVLVHGAFVDASSWSPVLRELRAAGVAASAVPNPLRGLTVDGEYTASIVRQVNGPVVLVGHSYGGPVITYASSQLENIRALVFVASFGLDHGASAFGSVDTFPPSELVTALQPRFYSDGALTGTELYIQPERFPSVFAADLPAEQAAVLAASQRPAADSAFRQTLAVDPGWKAIPSWFLVAGADRAINPAAQRAAAERMGSTTVEIPGGSHAIPLSQAPRVATVILEAIRTVG